MSHPDPSQDSYGRPDPSVAEAVYRREQGRRRVGNATRWVLAITVSGAAVLGAEYARAIPGVAAQPSTDTPGGSTHTGTSGGLQSPGQAPGTTTQAPQTQSGAS